MSELTKAIETYIERRKSKSTIQGFFNSDEKNKDLVMVWFEVHDKYEDALKAFISKFKQAYKAQLNKTYKKKAKVDLKPMFDEVKSQNSAMANGRRVLDEATNAASQKLILRLKRPLTTSSTLGPSTPTASVESSIDSLSPTPVALSPSPAPTAFTSVATSLEDKLNSYINNCISEGKSHGFNLQTQVHEVLGSKKIILLRKGQQCKKLIKQVDVDSLLKDIRSNALNREIAVDVNVYLKLATLLRDFNENINRRTMKIKLDHLYAEADEEDGVIIEIFSKLVQKLPNQERLSHVGEMELIVNFLDPILSPICHCPDKNRLLVWLSRQDENTSVLQPDAIMMATPQKTSDVTLGYVEVKPEDSMSNPELAFVDLVRLGTFGRTLMLRKSNRKAIVVQCIGYNVVFYLVSEKNEVTIMADILKIDIPKDITQIGSLLQKVDDLKRIISLYACQIESEYKNTRPLEDDINSMMENVNPKRRKQRVPSFSLV